MFLLIVTSVCVILSLYTGIRLFSGFRLQKKLRISAGLTVILTGFLYPLSFILRRYDSFLYESFYWYENFAIGFLSIVCALLIVRDLCLPAVFITKRLFPGKEKKDGNGFFYKSSGILILGISIILSVYGLYEAKRVPDVKSTEIKVKGLNPDLDGLKIVQITDLHITFKGRGKWLEKVVNKVNELEPDIFALTGDIADKPASIIKDEFRSLKKVKSKYGSFYVTGNHEYYNGADGWIEAMKEVGLRALMNENERIKVGYGNVLVSGVTDLSTLRPYSTSIKSDPIKAIDGASGTDYKILLAHQPKSIYEASKAGFDLQISGHTHGGQFFPWRWLVKMNQPFFAGLYKYKNMQIYVSRGTGFWGPPLRIGAKPEITLLTLKAG